MSMTIPNLRPYSLAIILCLTVSACASSPPPTKGDHKLVSEGYTLMYDTVSQLKFGDDLLLIKIESDSVDEIVTDISTYSSDVQGQLEDLAEEYPDVVILDLDLLPPMEVLTRESVAGERIPQLLSESGMAFERLLLLSQSGALNQTRHLAEVMVDTETDPKRKMYWQEVQKRLDNLYNRTVDLLNKDYFIQNDA